MKIMVFSPYDRYAFR